MSSIGSGTASTGTTINKTNITEQIKAWQQLASNKPLPDLNTLPPNYLQGAITQIMGRGLNGITFYIDDLGVSMKNEEVLSFLLGRRT